MPGSFGRCAHLRERHAAQCGRNSCTAPGRQARAQVKGVNLAGDRPSRYSTPPDRSNGGRGRFPIRSGWLALRRWAAIRLGLGLIWGSWYLVGKVADRTRYAHGGGHGHVRGLPRRSVATPQVQRLVVNAWLVTVGASGSAIAPPAPSLSVLGEWGSYLRLAQR